MRRIIASLSLVTCLTVMASPPEYFMGKYTNKLPNVKKAAALVLRNESCQSIATGLYIPPAEQLHPGKAYLFTCNAPSRPGGLGRLRQRSRHCAKPFSQAKAARIYPEAWQLCRNALSQRYGDSDSDVHRVRVSDNRAANRRVDAIMGGAPVTAHAYCIVEPSGRTETHILSQDASIRAANGLTRPHFLDKPIATEEPGEIRISFD